MNLKTGFFFIKKMEKSRGGEIYMSKWYIIYGICVPLVLEYWDKLSQWYCMCKIFIPLV